MKNLLRFRVGNIIGLFLRKVPHLPMGGEFTLFMVLNISTFFGKALVVTFLTKLVSSHLEFSRKSYGCYNFGF